MADIKKRLFVTDSTIKKAEIACNRQSGSVQLLAVSKTWPADVLRDAAMAGQRLFGENYLQEALVKIDALADLNLEWHFIGPIQSNKTKDIASHFDWVQSIDRLKIAQRLSNQRSTELADLNICIQVNIDNETSKSGVSIADLLPFAEQINNIERLCLRGLMIIPARTNDSKQQQASFKKAYQLYRQLAELYRTVDTLSMGMTGDMTAAIAEGSTMVRIGTALFGQRHTATGQVN